MMSKLVKRYAAIFLVSLLLIGGFLYLTRHDIKTAWQKHGLPPETTYRPLPTHKTTPTASRLTAVSPTPSSVFDGVNLAVPFVAQAPTGDWSQPYQDACEETSVILVDYFYSGRNLTSETAISQIQRLVAWEMENFGYYKDTNVQETTRMIKEVLGYKRVDVKYEITLDDIKKEISAGRPVIVPLAGQLLGNPYYTQPGPPYHMLVVKGFTKNGDVITNDVGTRRGNNFVYPARQFYDAIHDFPPGGHAKIDSPDFAQFVLSGRKAMIVIYPN